MSLSEDALENKLIKACKANDVEFIKGAARYKRGFPDRIIFNKRIHHIFYIELKNDTYYKQTKQQKDWQDIITASGGAYILLNGDAEVDLFINMFIVVRNNG